MSGEFHTNGVKFPARLVVNPPLSLTKSGDTYTLSIDLSGFVVSEGGIWVGQLHKALATLGTYDAVNEAVSATPGDSIRLSWAEGWRTKSGDTLYNFIKGVIGTSAANAAYALAPSMII